MLLFSIAQWKRNSSLKTNELSSTCLSRRNLDLTQWRLWKTAQVKCGHVTLNIRRRSKNQLRALCSLLFGVGFLNNSNGAPHEGHLEYDFFSVLTCLEKWSSFGILCLSIVYFCLFCYLGHYFSSLGVFILSETLYAIALAMVSLTIFGLHKRAKMPRLAISKPGKSSFTKALIINAKVKNLHIVSKF